MPKQKQLNSVCIDGRCPIGIDSIKKIGLSPTEKRAIFFEIKGEIFKQKKLRAEQALLFRKLPLF